jgi:hypothetical protein
MLSGQTPCPLHQSLTIVRSDITDSVLASIAFGHVDQPVASHDAIQGKKPHAIMAAPKKLSFFPGNLELIHRLAP